MHTFCQSVWPMAARHRVTLPEAHWWLPRASPRSLGAKEVANDGYKCLCAVCRLQLRNWVFRYSDQVLLISGHPSCCLTLSEVPREKESLEKLVNCSYKPHHSPRPCGCTEHILLGLQLWCTQMAHGREACTMLTSNYWYTCIKRLIRLWKVY